MNVLCTFKAKIESQIKIKMQNPSQYPPVSPRAPTQDLTDMNVLCTFKSRQIADIHVMVVLKTIEQIEIKIKMPNPSH